MLEQLLLFVIAILLLAIFWELSKIKTHFKKTFPGTSIRTEGSLKNADSAKS